MSGILRLLAIVAFLAFTLVSGWQGFIAMSWTAFGFSTLFTVSFMLRTDL